MSEVRFRDPNGILRRVDTNSAPIVACSPEVALAMGTPLDECGRHVDSEVEAASTELMSCRMGGCAVLLCNNIGGPLTPLILERFSNQEATRHLAA